MHKYIIICLDGCGPEYLRMADTPNLDRLAKSGWRGVGQAIVPTLTNVNNASLITGEFPATHGITGNYYVDRETGKGVFMESEEFLLAPTVFEHLARQGRTSALVTTKEKLRSLLGRGATISVSAESPPNWLVNVIGPPPDIYSVQANLWLFEAAAAILAGHPGLTLLYLTTSDYVMHTHGPAHEESQRFLWEFDRFIGELLSQFDGTANVVVTADHGMTEKKVGIDLGKILAEQGIKGKAVPIIKDRYVVHHQNLGGATYVYLERPELREEVTGFLREIQGVEIVLPQKEAAEMFHLLAGRIGDLMLLAEADTVFGFLRSKRVPVKVRSHGSLHEAEVPIIAYGPKLRGMNLEYNMDATRLLKLAGNGEGKSVEA